MQHRKPSTIFFFFEHPPHTFHSSTTPQPFIPASPPLHRHCTATAPWMRFFRGRPCIFFFFEQLHCTAAFLLCLYGHCTAATLPFHRDCFGVATSLSFLSNHHEGSTARNPSFHLHRRCTATAPLLHHRGGCSGAATIASVQSRCNVWFIFTFWVVFGFTLI